MEEFKKSLESFDHILKVNPDNITVLMEKGKTLGMIGLHQGAFQCFEKILEIDPHNQKAIELKKISINLLK